MHAQDQIEEERGNRGADYEDSEPHEYKPALVLAGGGALTPMM
jgi:hypothetical protein